MLQTRTGKRTAHGGAEDRGRHGGEGLIDAARRRCCASTRPRSTSCCTRRSTPSAARKVIAKGLPASPGAASGKVVFNADDAERMAAAGRGGDPGADRDLARGHPRHARRQGHPDRARRHDQPRRGGRARHGQGRASAAPATLAIDYAERGFTRRRGTRSREGDVITIDGADRRGDARRGADRSSPSCRATSRR